VVQTEDATSLIHIVLTGSTTPAVKDAVGRGVCGAAVAQAQVQRVEDVHAFDGHIACDAASNSEIVFPIISIFWQRSWHSWVNQGVSLPRIRLLAAR
ncbi:GAF domain-containing protein, partial [Klebsiella pneumoniae]|uniref:GAF domain-containing protein n=1 Tax=Klebsiella pneumoniae TaxID=573 RepID=UPI00359C887F